MQTYTHHEIDLNYRCSLFPHNAWVYLNLHHSPRLFTKDFYQCFLPTATALPGSPGKFPSCSWPSAAPARGFRSDKRDHRHPGWEGSWEPWTGQHKGHLWSTLIRLRAQSHPAVAAFPLWATSCHSKAVGLHELWGLSQPERFSDSMKAHSSQTTQTQTHRLCSFSVGVALIAFIVTIWEKRPLGDLNAKYHFFIQSPSLHVLTPWDSNFRRMKQPHQPSQSTELLSRDKSWWLHMLSSFPTALLPWNAPGSPWHWLYVSSSTSKFSGVLLGKEKSNCKQMFSRPWTTFIFTSWEKT